MIFRLIFLWARIYRRPCAMRGDLLLWAMVRHNKRLKRKEG